jgi:ABC-type Fe3+ transport system permease subunit
MAVWIAVAAGVSAVVLALTVLLLVRRQRDLEHGSGGRGGTVRSSRDRSISTT